MGSGSHRPVNGASNDRVTECKAVFVIPYLSYDRIPLEHFVNANLACCAPDPIYAAVVLYGVPTFSSYVCHGRPFLKRQSRRALLPPRILA